MTRDAPPQDLPGAAAQLGYFKNHNFFLALAERVAPAKGDTRPRVSIRGRKPRLGPGFVA